MSKKENVVDLFLDTVYDGYGALAASSFNEEVVLRDATEKIIALQAQVEKLENQLSYLDYCQRGG